VFFVLVPFQLHVTIRVVSVAGLESAFLSTDTATRTQYKNNKKCGILMSCAHLLLINLQ